MKRCLLPVLFGVLVVGCKQPQPTVALTSLCFPPTPESGGCAYSASCEAIEAGGRLAVDLSITNNYLFNDSLVWPIEIRNQSPSNADVESGRVNTSDAHITEFQMTYSSPGLTVPDGGAATIRQAIHIPADGTTVAVVSLIPKAYGLSLITAASADPVEVRVRVKAIGYHDNGIEFETAELEVPVEVCDGCWWSPLPPACKTATDAYLSCPQWGQSAAEKCVTP